MNKIDQRNRLDDDVFTYQVNKDKKVFWPCPEKVDTENVLIE